MRALHSHGVRQIVAGGILVPHHVLEFPHVQLAAMRARNIVVALVANFELFGNAAFALDGRSRVPEALPARKVCRSALHQVARITFAVAVEWPSRNFIAKNNLQGLRAQL